MAEKNQLSLKGKKVLIIGSERYSNIYKKDMEDRGATVVYPQANQDNLTDAHHAAAITKEILTMDSREKPDVVLMFHPRMDKHQTQGKWGFGIPLEESNPIRMAQAFKQVGIPTLILDSYAGRMTEQDALAIRDAGAFYLGLTDTYYDAVSSKLAWMAHKRAKLTRDSSGRGMSR